MARRLMAIWIAALTAFLVAPSAYAQTDVVGTAQAFVKLMPATIGGPKIAVLTRNDGDLTSFYYTAMQTLCATSSDNNWCDSDLVTVLTDTTNQMGWARILNYTSTTDGTTKHVCVILPPAPTVSATTIATGIGSGQVYDWRDLATQNEAIAWMWLHYGGICQGTDGGTQDTKTADAFASLSMTLIEGSTAFVAAQDVTPSRKFSFYDGLASTAWATNVGERLLLELWKGQAAASLSSGGCQANAVQSSDFNTPAIQRSTFLPPGHDCNPDSNGNRYGTVDDTSLWLWSTNGGTFAAAWPTVPLPPKAYTPFQGFDTYAAALTYIWQTSISIAKQY